MVHAWSSFSDKQPLSGQGTAGLQPHAAHLLPGLAKGRVLFWPSIGFCTTGKDAPIARQNVKTASSPLSAWRQPDILHASPLLAAARSPSPLASAAARFLGCRRVRDQGSASMSDVKIHAKVGIGDV